jgi:transposase
MDEVAPPPPREIILAPRPPSRRVRSGLRCASPTTATIFRASPELNPVERVWEYLPSHYMSNRVFKNYDDLFDKAAAAWNRLDQERLKSICHTEWAERAI